MHSSMCFAVELLILLNMSDYGLSSFLRPATMWALAGYFKHIQYILPFNEELSFWALHYLYWSSIENPPHQQKNFKQLLNRSCSIMNRQIPISSHLRPALLYCIQHKSSFLKCDHVPKKRGELKMQHLQTHPSFLLSSGPSIIFRFLQMKTFANISKTAQLALKNSQ